MATATQTILGIDHSDALQVVATDFDTEAKQAVAHAALAHALADPAHHEAIIAEIQDLHGIVASIKRDFSLVGRDLRKFDHRQFSDGKGGVIALHNEWATMERVRVSR
jgi:hypothetical protein